MMNSGLLPRIQYGLGLRWSRSQRRGDACGGHVEWVAQVRGHRRRRRRRWLALAGRALLEKQLLLQELPLPVGSLLLGLRVARVAARVLARLIGVVICHGIP